MEQFEAADCVAMFGELPDPGHPSYSKRMRWWREVLERMMREQRWMVLSVDLLKDECRKRSPQGLVPKCLPAVLLELYRTKAICTLQSNVPSGSLMSRVVGLVYWSFGWDKAHVLPDADLFFPTLLDEAVDALQQRLQDHQRRVLVSPREALLFPLAGLEQTFMLPICRPADLQLLVAKLENMQLAHRFMSSGTAMVKLSKEAVCQQDETVCLLRRTADRLMTEIQRSELRLVQLRFVVAEL
jgi:hypothetical protein